MLTSKVYEHILILPLIKVETTTNNYKTKMNQLSTKLKPYNPIINDWGLRSAKAKIGKHIHITTITKHNANTFNKLRKYFIVKGDVARWHIFSSNTAASKINPSFITSLHPNINKSCNNDGMWEEDLGKKEIVKLDNNFSQWEDKVLQPQFLSPTDLDYKNVALLQKFLTEKGDILSRKKTGLKISLHKKLTKEIKKCRNVGLLTIPKVNITFEKTYI